MGLERFGCPAEPLHLSSLEAFELSYHVFIVPFFFLLLCREIVKKRKIKEPE